MINFKKDIADPIKNSAEDIKKQADNLNRNIKDGAENLNKKLHEGGEALNKGLKDPWKYNYLIFFVPIVLILLTFIPMTEWILQIVRLIVCCSMGYVLFFEYRLPQRRDMVFFISIAMTVLFNPIIPFFIPGMLINIISILAIGYMAYLTQFKGEEKGNKQEKL